MVDQGSRADIMYPNLFKGLNLKLEDLTAYDSPLISFEGKAVIPKGQIRLPVQSSPEVVDVDFIMVKFPSGGLIEEIIGSQSMARQCITAGTLHQTEQESSASVEGGGDSAATSGEGGTSRVFEKEYGWLAPDTLGFGGLGENGLCHSYRELLFKVMPFGLKNARATYQRMMTRMFEPQLGKAIEVYVDDMVVKSKMVSKHILELSDTFHPLRRYKLRLNASKCSFGVRSGKFLGYMVTHRGIEVNPAQVKRPVYYVSKSLHKIEVHYLPLEKAILVVVHATRKLPHYFQSHMVVVLTQLPLKSVLRSAGYMGRITKWGTILGVFDIKYMPHTSMKGQMLADLVAEFAEPSLEDNAKGLDMDEKSVGMISCKEPATWKVYVDRAVNQRGSGVGLVLVSPEGLTFKKSLRLGFSATNDEAKYEALLVEMNMVQKMGRKSVQMFSDSQLVVGQVETTLEARDPRMQEYLARASCIKGSVEVTQEEGLWHMELLFRDIGGPTCREKYKTMRESATSVRAGNRRWLLVGTNYFTKWVEAEPLSNIKDVDAKKSTRETPFSMTYGAEAIIPLKTGFPTLKTSSFILSSNDSLLEKSLDLVEERRENAMVQLAYYQQKLKQGYDSHVKLRLLAIGDLVLRKVMGTAKNPAWGKLGPNWEGSYRITLVAGIGAYYLADLDEKAIQCSWNISSSFT
ncbi:uncharacterized protein LOC142612393 [Castanea sativa]|uniref:uncharacterized protein LOC142612393 n=1 Tax=Castanea sativa TaxID=21020 RepID=UPI003F6504C4